MRSTKTFSLEDQIVEEIERTRGAVSASQRVNDLLKLGLEAERRERLFREAAVFFEEEEDRAERQAFQSASVCSIIRE